MTARHDGIRPHYYIDYALHGAIKDVAGRREIEVYEAYDLAARLLVALDGSTGYQPRPGENDLAAVFDDLFGDQAKRGEG
ncbi:hypothetical protein [Haloarcula nitratireducens]|uniref:Uncharacterized protein n=1 Tax=Haloarcula nitratireducens TaxID=2487749 RepID=A0AAW4PG82_9EURY|nr:hypothetical protein [Halomicroarcula nitratireducens]MBX0296834.1 hypothetical protein [Halomicroarcula nitratireducens]